MDPNMSAASSSKIPVTIYHCQGTILKTRIFIHTTERPKSSRNGRCSELRFEPIGMQHKRHGQTFTYLPNPTLFWLTYCTQKVTLLHWVIYLFHSHLCSLHGFNSHRLPVLECSWKQDASYSDDYFSILGCAAMQFCMRLTFRKNLCSPSLPSNPNISTAGSSDISGTYVPG